MKYDEPMPTIQCAICNRPVQEWEWSRSYVDDAIVVKVRCHGDFDECRIYMPRSHKFDFRRDLVDATAFKTKRLT